MARNELVNDCLTSSVLLCFSGRSLQWTQRRFAEQGGSRRHQQTPRGLTTGLWPQPTQARHDVPPEHGPAAPQLETPPGTWAELSRPALSLPLLPSSRTRTLTLSRDPA